MESNTNNSVKIVTASLIGVAVGAALGVLFAPDKGSKTRSKLMAGARDMADDLGKRVKEEAQLLKRKAQGFEEDALENYDSSKSKSTINAQ